MMLNLSKVTEVWTDEIMAYMGGWLPGSHHGILEAEIKKAVKVWSSLWWLD